MKIFEKKRKEHRAGGHYFYGDFGETPAAISYVEAATDEELGTEPRHYSRGGYKYLLSSRVRLRSKLITSYWSPSQIMS